jgi:hypothetical protein
VEGLRAVETGGQVNFKLYNGTFKSFCMKALKSLKGQKTDFEKAWQKLISGIRQSPNGKLTVPAKSDTRKNVIYSLNGNDSLNAENVGIGSYPKRDIFSVYCGGQAKASGAFLNYAKDIICYMQDKCGLKVHFDSNELFVDSASNDSPYIFIIDEINRGEISKIFGELFFSIDPGYRGLNGKVKTQYANIEAGDTIFDPNLGQGWFYVPENVYIIGTMNDIDRSVESFDFAMRRRFVWKEIKANENTAMLSQLGELESEAKTRLIALNNAIWNDETHEGIEGLNSSYHVGASYFLKLKNYKDESDHGFTQLWELHLKPLLSEYLRGLPESDAKLAKLKKAYNLQNDKTA